MSRFIVDIEANGLLDTVTKIHCIVVRSVEDNEITCYHDDPSITPRHGSIRDCLRDYQNETWVGHNLQGYDIPAIQKLYPDFKTPEVDDTVVLSRFLKPGGFWLTDCKLFNRYPGLLEARKTSGEHSLGAWGHRLGLLKGNYGEDTDWQTFDQEMLDYCVQDTAVNLALLRALEKIPFDQEAYRLEMEFSACLDRMMTRGVHVDQKALDSLCATLQIKRAELHQEAAGLFPGTETVLKSVEYWEDPETGNRYMPKGSCKKNKTRQRLVKGPFKIRVTPFNPGSRDQIIAHFQEKYSWEPMVFSEKTGKAKLDGDILDDLPFPEAAVFSKLFEVDKRLGQVVNGEKAWIHYVKDGKIYGRIRHIGTRTHRCAHSGPNLGQVPAVGKLLGAECRQVFIPKPGWVLMGCDAAGLEGRVKAHYLQPYDGGAYVDTILNGDKATSTDIHGLNCMALGLDATIKTERDKSKTFYYAWLYGAGDAKLGAIMLDKAPHKSLVPVGKKYRAALEAGITGLDSLIRQIKYVPDGTKRPKARTALRLVDGAWIPSPFVHAAPNTLFQGAGARVMKKATVNLHNLAASEGYVEDEDWGMVLHVHDEFQCECRPEIAERLGELAVEAIRMVTDQFKFRCPLDGEAQIGRSWEATH